MKPDLETAVTNSALWAAAGDALGRIAEGAGEGTVKIRAGVDRVTHPVAWRAEGLGDVDILLPAGTYSDDTQLRLSVCRAIRGNGIFDAEVFARIEFTAWQAYAMGAGNGSVAAAANLAKPGVTWFSNFFETGSQAYVTSGGNGAAMRIQPHVWAAKAGQNVLLPVLRDALSSHGHAHGFCGAAFHAAALADILQTGNVGGPDRWRRYARDLQDIAEAIGEDPHLRDVWRPAWEHRTGHTVRDAVEGAMDELLKDIELFEDHGGREEPPAYEDILFRLGCLSYRYRGSGLKTALAASILAWRHRSRSPESALVEGANALASDTDTIATMAGALLGAASKTAPHWTLQDRDYIAAEARRLALIAQGHVQDEFAHPDPATWQPPRTPREAVGHCGPDLAIVGLGTARPFGTKYVCEESTLQWLSLPFGQTVFVERPNAIRRQIPVELLPGERRTGRPV
jgi:ADP-ribosylglycohydrolase